MLRYISQLSAALQSRLPFSFRVLYRVFFLRVIDLEILSTDGDPSRLMGQFATVFSTISFFSTIPVPFILSMRKPLPVPAMWTFEHFLIETTMTIAGIIAVLSWDSAFPDRRDMLVLGPLPVRTNTLFFSKIAALFAAPLLGMLAFNFFAGAGWPMVFAVGLGSELSLLRTLPAYWFTIFAAGAFFVLSVLALQGLAANMLPRQLFLHLSAFLQAALLCLLLSSYFLGPSLNSPAALSAPQNQRMLHWLPAYWFMGLFNQLNGSMRPELVPLAHRAWLALGLVALGAFAALLLSYFRMLPKIVEQPDILPATRSRSLNLGNSLAGVITLFSLRTLLRSRQHRMILSFYVGIGLTIILGFAHTKFIGLAPSFGSISTTFLFASILTVSLTVLALRVVIAIPITLRANWIFRATQLRPAHMYHRAVRISLLLLGVVPVLFAISAAFFTHYALLQIVRHIVAMALLGALIVELCLFTFRKISFACSYLPGKANLHFVFWVVLMCSIYWLKQAADFEGRMLNSTSGFLLMILSLAIATIVLHLVTSTRAQQTEELIFEEDPLPEIVSLKLNS
ncbi:hypothetical protein [Edaphobacter albus]|uniref:hypothetical protein n=1 Tax=Edaphobacter sp. 4G125 TaxID=2763071 RepID=UPI00164876C7|nr:hypothetical protein [Edaphobacter sp. 4G125]QNI37018.1 hypothetical protein H7846_01360 [Edaphobacter sp. 4G125]